MKEIFGVGTRKTLLKIDEYPFHVRWIFLNLFGTMITPCWNFKPCHVTVLVRVFFLYYFSPNQTSALINICYFLLYFLYVQTLIYYKMCMIVIIMRNKISLKVRKKYTPGVLSERDERSSSLLKVGPLKFDLPFHN